MTNDFIYISNEHYLQEMEYDSVEDWARDSDYTYDPEKDLWKDEEGEYIDIDEQLAFMLHDLTWGWGIETYALEQEYKMSESGDWVDSKRRYRVDPESELIEQFFDDQHAIRNAKRKKDGNG